MKVFTICAPRDMINKAKRQCTEWKEISVNDISNKGVVSRIYREFLKLNNNKNQID